MSRTLPPMMQVLKDIGGVEFPESIVNLGKDEPKAETVAASNGRDGVTPK
jgi:hypothetical protein